MALGIAGMMAAGGAQAEDAYPSRTITIVVPHPPGGAVDGVARLFADKLKAQLHESVIVENRPGASGMIGAAYVARAKPDGYTLYINASIHSINPLLYKKKITFDAVKDFTAVSLLAQGALIFSVNPKVPAHTVEQFITDVKADPNKYTFATSGFGSAGHLAAAQFLYDAHISKVPIVLYRGSAPALSDLVGGQVSAIMDPMLSSLPLVQSGKLRALAVTGKARSPLLPNVPTMREAGMKDFEFYSWYGLWSPAKLPPEILSKLEAASSKIMDSPEMKERLKALGFESSYKNSADFTAYIESEMARYKKVIDAAHITVS
nr:tripartite tricarboxylate transporter substrate binding protein [Candidimonas nitroreducens]